MNNMFYTPQDKQTIMEYFLSSVEGRGKKYRELVQSYYDTLSEDKALRPQVPIPFRHEVRGMVQLKKKEGPSVAFDTHDTLWDEKTGDNILTYFLKQPHFVATSTSLHQLNLWHPNWSHENKSGDTPLNLLARRGRDDLIEKIIKDFHIDRNLKNKDHKPYTHFLFKGGIDKDNLTPTNLFNRFMYLKDVLDALPEHFKISPKRVEALKQEGDDLMIEARNFYATDAHTLLRMTPAQDLLDGIKKTFNGIYLNNQLNKDLDEKTIVKANKI